MFKNVAAKFIVFAFDATTNVPKTGDAANITAYVSKDYGAVTVLGDTSAAEMDATNAPGYYLFDAAQAETNADVLMVSGKSSTANVKVIGAPAVIYTRPTTGWLAPATAGRTLVVDAAGLADANVVKVGPTGSGTAQTARDLGASVLLSSGTGTGQVKLSSGYVAPNWGDVGNPTTTVSLSGTTVKTATDVETDTADIQSRLGTPSDLGGGASIAANLADIEAQTDDIGAAGAGLTEAGGTGDHLTAVPWNAAWDAEVESEVDDALGGGTGTALTSIPWNASWDAEVQSEVQDALDGTIADSVPSDGTRPSVSSALYMITQFLLERSVSGTTVTVKKPDGSTTLLTLTLDDGTSPTSITRS